jgi:hypothetical protein
MPTNSYLTQIRDYRLIGLCDEESAYPVRRIEVIEVTVPTRRKSPVAASCSYSGDRCASNSGSRRSGIYDSCV